MICGYLMIVVFIRLFCVDPESPIFLLTWLYRITFALMPLILLQDVLQRPLLNGLYREYEGTLRSVPIIMPLCFLNMWIVLAKLLSSQRVAWHERIYFVLSLATIGMSFTRGVYVAAVLTALFMVITMARDRTLTSTSTLKIGGVAVVLLPVLMLTSTGQLIGGRAINALQLLTNNSPLPKRSDDNFHGRIGLLAERISLAISHNPLVGFGFIHEDDVPEALRSQLRYGTALTGTAADPTVYTRSYEYTDKYVLGLYTADIAWADIVIATGLVGVVLVIALFISLSLDYYRHPRDKDPVSYPIRLGCLMQFATMFVLMVDGDNFFGTVHIPMFLLATYTVLRSSHVPLPYLQPHIKPANLLG